MVPREEKEEGRNAAEECAASGPEAEGTGLAFLIKPVWKDEGLDKRKYNYKLSFDCDSGGFEPLPEPSKKKTGKEDFQVQSCAVPVSATARKSRQSQPVSRSYWRDYELLWNRGAEMSPERCTQR